MERPEKLLAHSAFVHRLAVALLRGDADAAADVVQETYVIALREGRRPPRHPRAWLSTIVRNLVHRRYRSDSRRKRREQVAAQAEATSSTVDTAARIETQRRVVAAVEALPEPYCTTIVLRYFDGLSPREIASRQSVPWETVRTRLQRGLDQLRGTLDLEWAGGRRAWSIALLPLAQASLSAGAKATITGGILMTTKTKLALVALPLLGGVVGVIGHSAYLDARNAPPPRATSRGVLAQTAKLESERDRLRREVETLRGELATERAKSEAAPPTEPDAPESGNLDLDAIDWRRYLPVLHALAKRDPRDGKRLDAAVAQTRDELIEKLATLPNLPDQFMVQDLWRLPEVGSRIAAALAADANPALGAATKQQIRTEIEALLRQAESALPQDALDLERFASVAKALTQTEEIFTRRTNPATARRALDVLAPLWKRDYWQAVHLGVVDAAGLQETMDGMMSEIDADTRRRVREIAAKMHKEFRAVRTDLARKHDEDTVRAVLWEPGKGGTHEAVLERRRAREDYATAERSIRATVAAHQARFEREYYEALPQSAQKRQHQIAATLFLFDVK